MLAKTKHRTILYAAGLGLSCALSLASHSMAADGSWTGNSALLRGGYAQQENQQVIQPGWQPNPTQQPSNLSGVTQLTRPTSLRLDPVRFAPAQLTPAQLTPEQLAPKVATQPDNRPGNCKALVDIGIRIAECTPGYVAPPASTQAQYAAPIMLPVQTPQLAPQAAPLVQQRPKPAPVMATVQTPPPFVELIQPNQPGPIITQSIGGGRFQPPDLNDDGLTADWSVTLRGTSVHTNTLSRFDAAILPQASLTRHGRNGDFTANINADLSATSTGLYRIDSGTLNIDGTYSIDRDTTLSGGGGITITQESTDAATTASGVTSPPLIGTADLRLGIAHNFGQATAGVSASAFRQVVGATGLSDGTWTNNDERNRNGFGLSTRLGFAVTPKIGLFTELGVTREIFDTFNSGLGANEDNWTYSGIIGISGNWAETVAAEATFGYVHRQFDDASLASAGTFLYGGNLTLRPSRTLEISANLSSTIEPSNGTTGATARFNHTASLRAQYSINDWLSANANVGANWAWYAASPDQENGYSAGVGTSYNFNKHISIGLDYGYTWSQSSTNGTSDAHRISLSTTFKR